MQTPDSTHSRPNLIQYLYPWSIPIAGTATTVAGFAYKISSYHLNLMWSNQASSTTLGFWVAPFVADTAVKQATNEYFAPAISGGVWFLTTISLNIIAELFFQAKAPPEPIAQMPPQFIPKNVTDAIQAAPATPKALVRSTTPIDDTEPEESPDIKALVPLRSTSPRRKNSFSFDNHERFVPPAPRTFTKEVSKANLTSTDETKASDILDSDDLPCEGVRTWCRNRKKKKEATEVDEA